RGRGGRAGGRGSGESGRGDRADGRRRTGRPGEWARWRIRTCGRPVAVRGRRPARLVAAAVAAVTITDRLDALARAVAAGGEVLPSGLVDRARAVEEHAGRRLRLSADHTVVAFAGATGSGKSSLVNALVGLPLAEVDVLRPTTSEALA